MSKKKKFKREDSDKQKKLSSSWRRPRGGHSRVRLEKKGALSKPKVGYRTPQDVRGKHPSGYEEVLVHRPEDLEDLEEDEAARIGSTVGGKKREKIVEKAEELDVKLLNAGELE